MNNGNSNSGSSSSSSNGSMTQKGREALERFKMESANELGVNLKQGYNGDLTSREAGSIGGRMVQKMINSYKQQ
ncbi:MAG: alpha/beta-type small acid-soluble spore protein [Ruminococcus sp.]|nr:alpha/beta-type small acid-soluble spore protein [Ruminococcus sp.]